MRKITVGVPAYGYGVILDLDDDNYYSEVIDEIVDIDTESLPDSQPCMPKVKC